MKELKLNNGKIYTLQYEWPEDCKIQGNETGLVLADKGNYLTAFFEAFPRNPNTFIRGEGSIIEQAEQDAWQQYQKQSQCIKHEFERRGYTNGAGFCKHCGFFSSKEFEPTTKCVICNKPTNWTSDKDGNYYCEEHEDEIPDEKMHSMMLTNKRIKRKQRITKLEHIDKYLVLDDDREIFITENEEMKSILKNYFNVLYMEKGKNQCINDFELEDMKIGTINNSFTCHNVLMRNQVLDFKIIEGKNRKYILVRLNEQKNENLGGKNYKVDNESYVSTGIELRFLLSTPFVSTLEFVEKVKVFQNKKED